MQILPQHIEEIFYKTIKGDIPMSDFEQWLYVDKEIEGLLQADDYLDLISLNFKKNGAKYDLWNLLKKHIDLGKYETYKMLERLHEAQLKTDRLPYVLMEFYHLYCKGYSFLQDIGLGYGLSVQVPRLDNVTAEYWDDLSKTQQAELLDSFSPELEEEIERVLEWIHSGKIVLTGEQDEMGNYFFQDFRATKT